MNLKNINNYIYSFFFICFFFFWDINFLVLKNFIIYGIGQIKYLEISYNLAILTLLVPLIYSSFNRKKNDLFKIIKEQRNILSLSLFILIHIITISFFYNKNLQIEDYLSLLFIFALVIIFCKYRNFLFINFDKIIFLFLAILIFFSLYSNNTTYNVGSCLADFYLINYFEKIFNLRLTSVLFKENSHLAMIIVGVLVSSTFFASTKENKYSRYLYLLSIIFLFIYILMNSSSIFFVNIFIFFL